MSAIRKLKYQDILPVVLILIVLLTISIVHSVAASRPGSGGSVVLAEEQQSRAGFQANGRALSVSRVNAAYSARLTGLAAEQAALSQRANTAYSARLSGLAAQEQGMSSNQRAVAAYSARLTSIAAKELAMYSSRQATAAYSDRLAGMAALEQARVAAARRAQAADAARWEAMARFYAGLVIPVTH